MSVNESKSNVVNQEAKIQNALARSAIYQFLSLCFFEPNGKIFPVLKSDEYLRNVQKSLDDYSKLNSFNAKASAIKENLQLLGDRLKEKSFEELSSEYRKVFESFIASKECPIYETLYGSTDTFQQTQNLQELADIGGFYRAFSLDLSEDTKERYDHLSIELEFMHFLTYKEAYALENHGKEQLEICIKAEKKFLKSHLGRWVPLFTKLVNKRAKVYSERSELDGFYSGIADFLRDFISLEIKLFKIKVEEATELNAEAMKEEDFQCGPGVCEAELDAKR
ncbi:MAG: molecular chaperone TorD family protein [Planctomycetes bacterium]|nr:molecular chaperone TorD family protein [Planctomycetota bacterium]